MRQVMQEAIDQQGGRLSATPFVSEEPPRRHPPGTPRVPSRAADLRKWGATWSLVRGQVRNGSSYEAMAAWLARLHRDLAYSPQVLADIVRAGQAGLLEPADA